MNISTNLWTRKSVTALLSRAFSHEDQAIVVKLIDDLKDLGLKYGTLSGQSVSLSDISVPKETKEIVEKGRKAVIEIDKNFRRGLITAQEVVRLTEDAWYKVVDEISESVWSNLSDINPVKVLVKSGSTRASRSQVNQIAGIKGLVADPTGKTVLLPLLGNYKTGLSGLEYFVGARGARKGLVDKGLKTADAGYLTRRLVDVSQEVIVREDDCGTENGRIMVVGEGTMLQTFVNRVKGRYLAEDAKSKGKVIAKAGEMLTEDVLKEIESSDLETILIRSPLSVKLKEVSVRNVTVTIS